MLYFYLILLYIVTLLSASLPSPSSFKLSIVRRPTPYSDITFRRIPIPSFHPFRDKDINDLTMLGSDNISMQKMEANEMPKVLIYRPRSRRSKQKKRVWMVKRIRKLRIHKPERVYPSLKSDVIKYRKAKTFSGRKLRHFANSIRSAQMDGDIVKYHYNPSEIRRAPPKLATTTRPSIIAPIPFLDELSHNLVTMEHNLNEILVKMAGAISPLYSEISPYRHLVDGAVQRNSIGDVQYNLTTTTTTTTQSPYLRPRHIIYNKMNHAKTQYSKFKKMRRTRKDKMNWMEMEKSPIYYRRRRRRRMKRELAEEQMEQVQAASVDDVTIGQLIFDLLDSYGIQGLQIRTNNDTFILPNDRSIQFTPFYANAEDAKSNDTLISIQSTPLENLSAPDFLN